MPKWSWFEGREIEWRKEFNGHSLCQQRFAFVRFRGKQSSPLKVSMSSESCASFFALALWCGLCYYYYQPEDCVSQFSYYHHMVGVYVPTYYTIVLRDSHIAGKKFWKISLSKILQVRLFVLTSDICCESELWNQCSKLLLPIDALYLGHQ